MKYGLLFLALLVGVILFGCGGGGGGGTSSTSTSTSTSSSTSTGSTDNFVTQVIAVNSGGTQVDPTNLQVGDSVTFKVAKIDTTANTLSYLGNTGFTTTDTSGAAGRLNGATGAFTATASTGTKTYTISTSSTGVSYSTTYAVTPVQARVVGQVIDSNGADVPFVQVKFFDASATQVGLTTATVTGAFNASVPATAKVFNLVATSISTTSYFEYFVYGAGSYSPLITSCSAPLPALTSGQATGLPSSPIVTAVSGPGGVQNSPPAPPSCSP